MAVSEAIGLVVQGDALMGSLLIVTLALAGVGAAVVAFLRTQADCRYRLPARMTTEARLAAMPERAEAVIIKADWRRALIKAAPMTAVFLIMLALVAWSTRLDNAACASLFGFPAPYIALLLLCYVVPVVLLTLSLLLLPTAIKTLKTGYFPPLDSPGFKDRIARKGVLSTCRGGLLLLMPLFGIYLVSLGHQVYGDLMEGRSVAQVAQVIADECRLR